MQLDWWTLGFQTVNVLILIWILGRFFWRPMAAMIAERRAMVAQTIRDAEALKAKAEAAEAEIAATRNGFALERERLLADARRKAEAEARASREALAHELAGMRASLRTELDAERARAEAQWARNASRLAVDVARKLLGGLEGAAVRQAFADRLIGNLEAMPERERRGLAGGNGDIEAITADKVPDAERERLAARLRTQLGDGSRITFRTDPDLIAGFELRGPHLSVANSWRADLAAIEDALTHDDRP